MRHSDSQFASTQQNLSRAASLFSAITGLSVVCGWYGHINILKSWIPGQVTMRMNTAVCFILLGGALWLLQEARDGRAVSSGRRMAAQVLAGAVLLIGLVTLSEHLFHWNAGIDQLLYTVRPGDDVGAIRPGLISLPSAVSLGFLSLALLLLDWKRRQTHWPAQFPCLAAMIAAVVGLLDFILRTNVSHTHISLPSSITLLVLSWGAILARPHSAFGGLLTSNSPGAWWLRRAGPSALLVLGFVGSVTSRALLTTVHFTWLEVCVLGIAVVLLLAVLMGWTALLLDRGELQRKRSEETRLDQEGQSRLRQDRGDSPVDTTMRRWSTVAIGMGVLLAAAGGFDSLRSLRKASENADWVAHTHAVNAALGSTLAHTVEIETGARGFAATGEALFLQPYSEGQRTIGADLDSLQSLTADDSFQQLRVEHLRSQVSAKLDTAALIISTRQRTGRVPDSSLFLQGKQRMDRIQQTISEMQREENELLRQRSQMASVTRQRTAAITLISTLFAVAMLVVAGLILLHEINRGAAMRGQIQALNSSLERRVEERTAALHESERHVRALMESTAEAIVGNDMDGNCTFCNPAALTLLGYTDQAELLGKNLHAAMHHSQADGTALSSDCCPIGQAVRSGSAFHADDVFFWRKDGTCFPAECWSHPVFDDGDTTGAVLTFFDISERKRAEEAIREGRAQLDAALASMTDAVFISDAQGRFLHFNQAFATFHKFKSKAECAKTIVEYPRFLEVFMDNGQPAPLEMWAVPRALRGEAVTNAEYSLRRRDTGESWVGSYSFAPIRDRTGAIVGSVVVGRDITERKRADAEICKLNRELEERVQQRTAQLRESEQSVRRKLDSILLPEANLGHLELTDVLDVEVIRDLLNDFHAVVRATTALLDLEGNILVAVGWQDVCTKFHRVHPASCQHCKESDVELSEGVPAGEFKIYKCKNLMWDVSTPIVVGGKHMGNLFCGQFFFADEAVDPETFREQARKYGFQQDEYLAALDRVPRLQREEVNASMTFLTRLAKVISQLSYSRIQLARSSAQLGCANAELAASVKEMEAFTYSVSHDLRAPLRHISGFSKILSEEFKPVLPAEAQRYIDRISDGTRRMGLLVDDLLNLGRVARQEMRLQVTGLRSIVDQVISELHPECADRQVEWKIGALPFVDCDPGLLKQVLQNLLSNALKFTRPRTPAIIEVGQREDSDAQVIYVRDNGVGFSMKYADKLFGVFQRLHRQEDFEGTGVGLATVQRIIQKHGGRIWAEAELDRGATFYFTLAAEGRSAAAAAGG